MTKIDGLIEEAIAAELPAKLLQTLNFIPHSGELDALTNLLPTLYRVPDSTLYWAIECSRRWGKTELARIICWIAALQDPDFYGPPYIPIISDTHEHASKIWDRVLRDLYTRPAITSLLAGHDKERERITLKNGAIIQRFSSDNPASLSGEGATLGIVDESQFVQDAAISNFMPSVTERNGAVVAFGVCENDDNWFDQWGERGDDPDFPEYGHLVYPWYTSPFISGRVVEVMKGELGADMFARRYEARRPQRGEELFRNLNNCIINPGQPIDPGFNPLVIEPARKDRRYVAGLDLAKQRDFTVLHIADSDTGKLTYFHRLPHQSYGSQATTIAVPIRDYSARCLVDITGVGNAAIEQFRGSLDALYQREWDLTGNYPDIRGHYEGLVITNAEKVEMVDKLVVLLEYEKVKTPLITPLFRELRRYKRGATTTGKSTFAAPSGFNDDCVSSFLLMCKLLPKYVPTGISRPVERNKGSWESI